MGRKGGKISNFFLTSFMNGPKLNILFDFQKKSTRKQIVDLEINKHTITIFDPPCGPNFKLKYFHFHFIPPKHATCMFRLALEILTQYQKNFSHYTCSSYEISFKFYLCKVTLAFALFISTFTISFSFSSYNLLDLWPFVIFKFKGIEHQKKEREE